MYFSNFLKLHFFVKDCRGDMEEGATCRGVLGCGQSQGLSNQVLFSLPPTY